VHETASKSHRYISVSAEKVTETVRLLYSL
jgi:hypothetical protein